MAAMKASTRRRRVLAALAAASVASVATAQALGAGTAASAGGPRLTADAPVVAPGSTLTLHGSGFPPQARLTLLAAPPHRPAVRIGSAVAGSRGGFVARIRIRARSAPGAFVASACNAGCRVAASVRFRIATP